MKPKTIPKAMCLATIHSSVAQIAFHHRIAHTVANEPVVHIVFKNENTMADKQFKTLKNNRRNARSAMSKAAKSVRMGIKGMECKCLLIYITG
jgi:hypothetical protein